MASRFLGAGGLSVLVATIREARPGGLDHLPAHVLRVDGRPGWAAASNVLLDAAAADGHAAIFCDDDVTFTAEAWPAVARYRDRADVLGFRIAVPGRGDAPGAQHVLDAEGRLLDRPLVDRPCEVAHVTTTACYLSPRAVRQLRFPEWPGVHSEDVAFCLDAWLQGLRVAYVGGLVWHEMTGHGIGQTKVHTPDLIPKLMANSAALRAWMAERDVAAALRDGRIPVGQVWMEDR